MVSIGRSSPFSKAEGFHFDSQQLTVRSLPIRQSCGVPPIIHHVSLEGILELGFPGFLGLASLVPDDDGATPGSALLLVPLEIFGAGDLLAHLQPGVGKAPFSGSY